MNTFALPAGAGAARAERLLAAALPTEDPDCVVLAPRSFSSLAESSARSSSAPDVDFEAGLRRSLEASNRRLSPQHVGLLEWRLEPVGGPSLPDAVSAFERLRSQAVVTAWVLALAPGAPPSEPSFEDSSARTSLYSGALSILEPRETGALAERAAAPGPFGFFARDPLGGGRLDGSRFVASMADRRPDAPPVPVRELRLEFDPVLRLGFLTAGRPRTLAQSALQFLYRWPWVCSALVPLPSPERLPELLRAATTPALTDSEVARILHGPE